jgi:hypothetical protein
MIASSQSGIPASSAEKGEIRLEREHCEIGKTILKFISALQFSLDAREDEPHPW